MDEIVIFHLSGAYSEQMLVPVGCTCASSLASCCPSFA